MSRFLSRPLAAFAVALTVAACGGDPKPVSDVGLPPAGAAAQAPNVFRVRFETSKGAFTIEARRAWAPRGVDRFHQLVQSQFFDNTRFFRAVTGFMVQFGLHGDPGVNAAWEKLAIPDDSVAQSNRRGFISFAMAGPNTRTTQLFINLVDNTALDGMGFAPIAQVVDGMAVIDSLYAGYGDGPPAGFGPDQMRIMAEGNAYLEREFPRLDFVRTARFVETTADSAVTAAADSVTGRAAAPVAAGGGTTAR